MKKTIIALLLALTFIVSGCDFIRTKGMRVGWLKDHPWVQQTTPAIATAIANGEIIPGMTKAEVLASWGYPHSPLGTAVIKTPYAETWIYQMYPDIPGTSITFDATGHVVSYLGTQ